MTLPAQKSTLHPCDDLFNRTDIIPPHGGDRSCSASFYRSSLPHEGSLVNTLLQVFLPFFRFFLKKHVRKIKKVQFSAIFRFPS